MILTALLLTSLAIAICVLAIRKTFALLGLDLMETLLWLGIAEIPAPPTRRRPRLVTD